MIQITKNVAARSKLHHLIVGILESSCFFNDAPTKWLIPGSGRGAVPEIPPLSRRAWVFRWLKIERFNYPKLMLEDGCRNSSLYPLFVAWRRGEKKPFSSHSQVHSTGFVACLHLICQAARAWWGTLKSPFEIISNEHRVDLWNKMLMSLTLSFIIKNVVEVSTWNIYITSFSGLTIRQSVEAAL